MRSEPPDAAPDLVLRPAASADAEGLARLLLAAREAARPAMPAFVHPAGEVRRWLLERVHGSDAEVWLAERDDVPAGLLLLQGDWLHSLYVAPGLAGQGVGSTLLALAKGLRSGGLGLWVFQSNEPARRFYERRGFREVRRTDGSDNEEHEPDIEMAWPGSVRAAR